MKDSKILLFSLILFLLTGCTSTPMKQTDGILKSENFFPGESSAWLYQNYRTGSVYEDFRIIFTVDAIPRNSAYLNYFFKEQKRANRWSEEVFQKKLSEEQGANEFFQSFVLYIYNKQKSTSFARENSDWKFFFKNNEGNYERSVEILKLNKKNPEFLFLNKNFKEVNPWIQVYLIKFPRIPDTNGQTSDEKAKQILVAGIKGEAKVVWK